MSQKKPAKRAQPAATKSAKEAANAKARKRKMERERPSMGRATIPPALHDKVQRAEWDLPESESKPGPYMVELNLMYREGLMAASDRFKELYSKVLGKEATKRPPILISRTYYRCKISVNEWRKLVKEDEKAEKRDRVVYRIWPDFPVKPLIDRSVATVKGDAAVRAYAAHGAGIVWAVIDSGIDCKHAHFGDPKDVLNHRLLNPDVAELHRDFSGDGEPVKETALTDGFGHGTHVAGIIAGGLAENRKAGKDFQVYEKVSESDPSGAKKSEKIETRRISDSSQLRGVAPKCNLISLKVLDDDGAGRASNVMHALQYIREELNGDPKLLRVQGVNLSIGYEFDAEMFACGQSPLCVEVDRLVKSGVVVVVAAGNTGYGKVGSIQRLT
jgi:serine protease AprX